MNPRENGFSVTEQAFIRQLVYEVVNTMMRGDAPPCRFGRKMERLLWIVVGFSVGSGVLSITAIARILL